MKLFAVATLLVLVISGCGGKTETTSTTSPATSPAASTSTAASGCAASGLDAMTALSSLEMDMGKAQKDGKLTVDQLTAARDKLFNQTQAAADKDDWAAYCEAIDDMRAELGL